MKNEKKESVFHSIFSEKFSSFTLYNVIHCQREKERSAVKGVNCFRFITVIFFLTKRMYCMSSEQRESLEILQVIDSELKGNMRF